MSLHPSRIFGAGDHGVIILFQQVIAAIAAAHADERSDVLTAPEFMKFMHAPVNATSKVKIAVKNILRLDRLVSHLPQAVAASQKAFAVKLLAGAMIPILSPCRKAAGRMIFAGPVIVASAKKFSLADQLRRSAKNDFAIGPAHHLRAANGMHLHR